MEILRKLAGIVPTVEVSRVMDAPPAAVWDILIDTRQWPRWGPTVRAVRCSHRRIERGSEGAVQTTVGVWLPFVVTQLTPEAYWSWEVASVPATGHRLRRLGPGRCEVAFEVPLPAAPYLFVCRLALNRIAEIAAPQPA
ncbi:MAG: SRPBCC family protein [Syntrophobacteraceae bacterium]|jgi:hypothetical protein|nr:SRPBCC family protein [Syntrophobacteraceae bacterium]